VTFTGPSGVNIAGPDAEATPQLAQEFAHDGVEVVANVSAAPYGCPCAVSTGLLGQLTGSVRWAQSMRLLLDEGVETFYEVGPGKVLKGLMRRIERRADVTSVNSRDAVEKLAEKL
jgi:[acyl-carrier-protein] S-malonyltransferase